MYDRSELEGSSETTQTFHRKGEVTEVQTERLLAQGHSACLYCSQDLIQGPSFLFWSSTLSPQVRGHNYEDFCLSK